MTYEYIIQYRKNGITHNARVYTAYANNNSDKAVLNSSGTYGFSPSEVIAIFKYNGSTYWHNVRARNNFIKYKS